MKVALGSDHGGYELKEKIKQYLYIPDIRIKAPLPSLTLKISIAL